MTDNYASHEVNQFKTVKSKKTEILYAIQTHKS